MRIAIINGPNLGRLGRRQPEVYGADSWQGLYARLEERWTPLGVMLESFQSNHEGALVDYVEQLEDNGVAGLIINPGALTHQSYVMRDALAALNLPIIEVHLTNIHAREEFRHVSVTAPVVWGQIVGLGAVVYELAVEALWQRLGTHG